MIRLALANLENYPVPALKAVMSLDLFFSEFLLSPMDVFRYGVYSIVLFRPQFFQGCVVWPDGAVECRLNVSFLTAEIMYSYLSIVNGSPTCFLSGLGCILCVSFSLIRYVFSLYNDFSFIFCSIVDMMTFLVFFRSILPGDGRLEDRGTSISFAGIIADAASNFLERLSQFLRCKSPFNSTSSCFSITTSMEFRSICQLSKD